MNCIKCGKYLGPIAAILKGKDVCKRCNESFKAKAREESGLLIVEKALPEKTGLILI